MAMLATHALGAGHEVFLVYSPHRADEALIGRLHDAGCMIRPSRMERSVGLHDLKDAVNLRSVLNSLGTLDVIHGHSSKAGALARTFGRRSGTAQIYSPHGFYTMTGEAPFYIGPVERLLSHISDRIIAVSQLEADHGASIGISPRKLTVIPNGIDAYEPLDRAEARAKLGLDAKEFAIGFVGRLADQKDPMSALAAVDALPGNACVSLTIIGDGELRSEVDRSAAAAKHRVNVTGGMPAARLLSAFDCLLCTSRYEGMPVSFLEALNCGVPIVTYDVGGAAELVSQPGTGFVTEHDRRAAAAAVTRIVEMSSEERLGLSDRCRAVARHYSAARMGDSMLALYDEVLARRS